MRKDPYAKERAELKLKTKGMTDPMQKFYSLLLENAKGDSGYSPIKGKDYWTQAERSEIITEIVNLIPKPKDGADIDYDLVLTYIAQEVEKKTAEVITKLPKPKDGEHGKDAVVDIPAIVESLLKVMPKMESTEVDYLGVKEYIDKQITAIKAEPRVIKQFTGGGATSLKQLTDVVLSGLTQDAQGNYILGGGTGGGHTIEDEGTPLTTRTKLNFVGAGVTVTDDAGDDATVVTIPGGASTASGVTFTPAGSIAATDVQAALEELDADVQALSVGAGISRSIVVTSGNVNAGAVAATDYVYKVAGAHTVTLPTAVSNNNQYDIVNLHTASVSLATTSAQTIHGTASPITLVPNQSLTLQSDGANWIIK